MRNPSFVSSINPPQSTARQTRHLCIIKTDTSSLAVAASHRHRRCLRYRFLRFTAQLLRDLSNFRGDFSMLADPRLERLTDR